MPAKFKVFWTHWPVNLSLVILCTVRKPFRAFCCKKRSLDHQFITNLTFIFQFHQNHIVFVVAFVIAELRLLGQGLLKITANFNLIYLFLFYASCSGAAGILYSRNL